MTKVHAIFENGVFRPIDPVKIADGVQVELSYEEPAATAPKQSLAAALDDIAKLPLEGASDAFSGQDHNQVFSGKWHGQ